VQYKIPVQIENEDPILLWLSLRQLIIIVIWWWIAYSTFKSLVVNVWTEIALIPSLIIFWITLLIALFKQYEMTFIPFILSLLRFNINAKERVWQSWVDSFQPIEIWFIQNEIKKDDQNIDFKNKMEQIKTLEDKIKKI